MNYQLYKAGATDFVNWKIVRNNRSKEEAIRFNNSKHTQSVPNISNDKEETKKSDNNSKDENKPGESLSLLLKGE